MAYPKWATPTRRLILAQLLLSYLSPEHLGEWLLDLETGEIYHPEYEERQKELIEWWKEEDREERKLIREQEERELHFYPEYKPRRSLFDRQIYLDNQPLYYVEAIGVSPFTFKPFAKVRLASSYIRLFVDLGDTLKPLSKNKRRKALRYGKIRLTDEAQELISRAVKHYLNG